MASKLDTILAGLTSIATAQNDLASRIAAIENSTQATVKTTAPKTAPAKTTPAAPASDGDVLTVRGTVSYVAVKGNGCQLDGPMGESDASLPWYNAHKGKLPFADLLGKRIVIEYVVLTLDNGRTVNRVQAVKAATKAVATPTTAPVATTAPVKPVTQDTNLMGLAVRAAVPTSSGKSCKRCSGPVHGKTKQASIIEECLVNQFVKVTGSEYRPHNIESRVALTAWMDAYGVIVAVDADGSKGARIGGQNVLSAAPVKTAPAKQATVKTAPAATTGVETLVGKILKVNNAGTKIQFQVKGQKFQWLPIADALQSKAAKAVGKTRQILVGNGVVGSIELAPKA